MPKYRFVTGRYTPQGDLIKFGTPKTPGKLSTMKNLRYGAQGKPKKAQTKKPEKKSSTPKYKEYTTIEHKGKFRKVYTNKEYTRQMAKRQATKYLKSNDPDAALFAYAVTEKAANNFIKSLRGMATKVAAPVEIIEKINQMNPIKAATLAKLNNLSVEYVFDYGFDNPGGNLLDAIMEKWDDLQSFINLYEQTWGVI